ncbi:3,4-dihydroxy-2-butanone-4-phosphate synthase [Halosolutus amylolyticus]|uniref:3,4-dihydroxy-2-butanone 4-phosphate synthase n=1 Tax=Halosolutus amylolyticus TaxID=2932267 RepID=A0ABD5PIX0_9EURY|nr:3,4-dihydroxy-2-butanone-4-phosphate synthase [Halosolutus amylolyticus]
MSRSNSTHHTWETSNVTVDRAISAFRAGNPILIHDHGDREGETDLVYPAGDVTPESVARLRNDAGGLICVALSDRIADAWELPFLADELTHSATDCDHRGYDERSSFSLTVNHRDTYTGITDEDRALTISELGAAALKPVQVSFETTFQVPGHVHLLRGAPDNLDDRQGHTELAIAVATAANRAPAAVVCEMLDDETGDALSPEDAKVYGKKNGIPYVEGADIIRTVTQSSQ